MTESTQESEEFDLRMKTLLATTIPMDVEQQLMSQIEKAGRPKRDAKPILLTRRGLLAVAGSGLAMAAVGSVILTNSPDAWADVVETTIAHPWLHFSSQRPEGAKVEMWISFSQGIFAMKGDDSQKTGMDFMHFQNQTTQECLWFRSTEGVLHQANYRNPPAELGQLETLLKQMNDGSATLEVPGLNQILNQSRRVDARDGETIWLYEFRLKTNDGGRAETLDVAFEVAPGSRLLRRWIRKSPDGKQEMAFDVDYPSEGPVDIYSLGVPREVEAIPRRR